MLNAISSDIFIYIFFIVFSSGARLDTSRLDTSHSQRLNSEKPLDTGRRGW